MRFSLCFIVLFLVLRHEHLASSSFLVPTMHAVSVFIPEQEAFIQQ